MNNLHGLSGLHGSGTKITPASAGKPKGVGLAVGGNDLAKNEVAKAYMWGIGIGSLATLLLCYALKK